MRILITNDDGLGSHGLTHLEAELAADAEVWAVAPDRERSATSQAITVFQTMRLIRAGERHFRLTGFPADCVNVALFSDLFPKFDLVISGINHGVNLGDDIHYSGTVGAARHAALHGYRALAVSTPMPDKHGDFHRPARWLREWLGEYLEFLEPTVVYNINYPGETDARPNDPLPDFRITRQGRRRYNDEYEIVEEGQGDDGHYRLLKLRDNPMGHDHMADGDFVALEAGLVAVCPLTTDTTHAPEIERWTTNRHSANS